MKYAFIDYHNTDTTTKKLLGFRIDWLRLHDFLVKVKGCEKVFMYLGVDEGDIEMAQMLTSLASVGCVVRSKKVSAYKNKDKELEVACSQCGHVSIVSVDMGYNRKSNCDVDLTVDAMKSIAKGNEFYVLTGDGDFVCLMREAIEQGVKVHVVSTGKRIPAGPRFFLSRLSKKIRVLIGEKHGMMSFVDINSWKRRIECL